jgi:hypothetical protein
MPALVGEVLVVDGGSSDGTGAIARLAGARVAAISGGRGAQLALGAGQTVAPWLLFLHGDTRLPPNWASAVTRALASPPAGWYFQLQIEGAGLGLTLLQVGVALRSRWLQRPYGDQGLLVRRGDYLAAGGFRPLPLMEDLDLVERLAGRLRLRGLLAIHDDRHQRCAGKLTGAHLGHPREHFRTRGAVRGGEDHQRRAPQLTAQHRPGLGIETLGPQFGRCRDRHPCPECSQCERQRCQPSAGYASTQPAGEAW